MGRARGEEAVRKEASLLLGLGFRHFGNLLCPEYMCFVCVRVCSIVDED